MLILALLTACLQSAPIAQADEVPPGGKIVDGVIYDAAGKVFGCEGGGNWCSPNPLHGWTEPTLGKCDDIKLLTQYEYSYIRKNFCTLCKDVNEEACVMDWPVNDVPECSFFDGLRNGIFAYYGYPFKNATWREKFKAWYVENPTYNESMLSEAARKNVATLKKIAETKQGCQ
jgi:hypothetical protein